MNTTNQETLSTLQRALELVEGFALYFVSSDLSTQRKTLLAQLSDVMGPEKPVFRVDLNEDESVIRRVLAEAVRVPAGGSLHVFGLERQMSANVPYLPVLQHLNLGREHLRKSHCPIIFWLCDAALTRLARGAPDFWAWRSGVFEFLPE